VPQHSQNMRLGNLIWSVVSQDVIRSIASLVVIWNMLLPTGEWIQRWLVDGVTTGLRMPSQVKHQVGRISSNFCILDLCRTLWSQTRRLFQRYKPRLMEMTHH
jgi:hypothetical protein